MAAWRTDKQKKKIIADYVQLGNYSAAARLNGVSRNTVKKIVMGNAEVAEMCQQKKEENSAAILAHMEQRSEKVCGILDKMLEALDDEQKLHKTGAQALATSMGILIDKFLMTPQEAARVKAQIASLRGEDAHTQQDGDDPITKSIKEHFGEG